MISSCDVNIWQQRALEVAQLPADHHRRCAADVTWRSSWGYAATGSVQKQSIYNYLSKCCHLSSKYDGKGFMAISVIAASLFVLSCKVKKTPISPKIDLWPGITRLNVDLRSINIPPTASTRWGQTTGLCCEALRRLVSKRRGSHRPLLPGCVMKNTLPGRGLRSCQHQGNSGPLVLTYLFRNSRNSYWCWMGFSTGWIACSLMFLCL